MHKGLSEIAVLQTELAETKARVRETEDALKLMEAAFTLALEKVAILQREACALAIRPTDKASEPFKDALTVAQGIIRGTPLVTEDSK